MSELSGLDVRVLEELVNSYKRDNVWYSLPLIEKIKVNRYMGWAYH